MQFISIRKEENILLVYFDDVHVTDSGSEDLRPITERCLAISSFQHQNIATYQNKQKQQQQQQQQQL